MQDLKVTTHVGRDLLQSAQLFRHEHTVVWEYVSNGLQYKDPGTKPTVAVKINSKEKRISVSDSGRGMSAADLHRYFQMHGENLDRKQGKPGRGFFGTGKSAAFGIANALTITTIRAGKRSKVRLTRADIDRSNGNAIAVKVIESDVATPAASGTLVEIDDIFLKQIDTSSIVRHIERHIAHWPDASVLVNNHQCEYFEPDANSESTFSTKGTEFELLLGAVNLVIKTAKAPLDNELRGIAILADGVWHETTLAGCDRKPFHEYLFGSLDVPALGNDRSPIPPFDMSRSMRLNPRNETVAAILRFVGVHLEQIRRDLEQRDRERRQTEEQKRLKQQGSKIAELINKHFNDWRSKLRATRAKAGIGKDLLSSEDRDASDQPHAIFGDELPAVITGYEGSGTSDSSSDSNSPARTGTKIRTDDTSSSKLAKPSTGSTKPSKSGGFDVTFERIGVNEKRAKYDRDTRTIIVNLEHPRIALELNKVSAQSPVDDPVFVRMAYEIAFTEYAIVLAQELSVVEYFYDPADALFEVRQTIDDLSKTFAGFWNTSLDASIV